MALSHKELLRDCLGPELAGKMERDSTMTVKEADSNMASLTQRLKVRSQGGGGSAYSSKTIL